MSFGRSFGGGRRFAQREHAPVHVTLSTRTSTQTAVLVDFSPTGARLQGKSLPRAGEDLVLTVERLRTFATVAWSEGDQCGLQFDLPLPADVMASVRASFAIAGCWTPELRKAFEDWNAGLAR